jgi:hypothetical protein
MPTYNVHLYREMRLFFLGIEADTPEQAAKMVAEYPSEKAKSYEDCEGVTLAALVDLVGDEDFSESVTIDLDPMKAAAQELYEALEMALKLKGGWREAIVELEDHCSEPVRLRNMLAAVDQLDAFTQKAIAVLAKARGETLAEAA